MPARNIIVKNPKGRLSILLSGLNLHSIHLPSPVDSRVTLITNSNDTGNSCYKINDAKINIKNMNTPKYGIPFQYVNGITNNDARTMAIIFILNILLN